jgi:NADH-ubiquinone oxidoreductase chain 6
MKNILINILAFTALLSAVLVITSKNPVVSVVYLIVVFCSSALYLILFGINFIGISYIIIYVGAIAIIFLFIIMMINIKLSDILVTGKEYSKNFPLAAIIGLFFIYEMLTILPFTFNNISGITYLLETLNSLNELFINFNNSELFISNNIFVSYNSIFTNVDTIFSNYLNIQSIGQSLYNYGAILLIIISIILLLGMLAPIFISKNTNEKN